MQLLQKDPLKTTIDQSWNIDLAKKIGGNTSQIKGYFSGRDYRRAYERAQKKLAKKLALLPDYLK